MTRRPARRTRAYQIAAENIHRGRARARELRRLRGSYPRFDVLVRVLEQVESVGGRVPHRRAVDMAIDMVKMVERQQTVDGYAYPYDMTVACHDVDTVVLDGTTWAVVRLPREECERLKRDRARSEMRARYQFGPLSDCLAPRFGTGGHPVRQAHWWEPGRRLSLAAEL